MSENEFKQNDENIESNDTEFKLEENFSNSKKPPEFDEDITQEEISKGRTMSLLSYIIPIIPYLSEERKNNKFVKFHSTQGMNLFLLLIIYTVVYNILTISIKVTQTMYRGGITIRVTPWWISLPLSALGCVLAVLDILGIIQVFNGETNKLPIIKDLKIFK